jgi:hypothetical protein
METKRWNNIYTYTMTVLACCGSMFWLVMIEKGFMRFITNHYVMTEIFKSNLDTLIFFVLCIIQGRLCGKFYIYYKTKLEIK